ncbi:hypothetical protein [Clostridium sp. SM-530-WT-3G]|uniref:hypothetical protein n=1 Tax=Clostridium sp. SM-530-WT-3G TaxID=2725303 RepID=UPI00325B2967
MAKVLLETNPNDRDIYNSKIELAEELIKYDKVKNIKQVKETDNELEIKQAIGKYSLLFLFE